MKEEKITFKDWIVIIEFGILTIICPALLIFVPPFNGILKNLLKDVLKDIDNEK